jgi:hypothetical protein
MPSHGESTTDHDSCPEGIDDVDEFAVPADPGLVAEGWVRRYLTDPIRAEEAIDLYTSMGYEVTVRKLTPADFGPMCGTCASSVCRSYVVVYTRKKEAG